MNAPLDFTTTLLIALAGALGTLARYLTGHALAPWSARFPAGTFTINLLGSLAIGFVIALFAVRGEMDSRLRAVLTIGFLGGFTTYSAFAYETVNLIERRAIAIAALYAGGTLVAAGLACALGLMAGRMLR